jgi:uncharacterized protein with GYD domain
VAGREGGGKWLLALQPGRVERKLRPLRNRRRQRTAQRKRKIDMPFYMTQSKLSKDAIQALIAKPQDRSAPIAKLLKSVGGKLHHYFFAFGDYDIVVLYEAPDNASAGAAVLAALGSGATSTSSTTVLMSMEEAVAAMTKASTASGAYRPPTS